MTMTITITVIVVCVVTLASLCLFLYLRKPDLAQRRPRTSYSELAISCIRNDPHIARIVLTLANLESSDDKVHVRRKKSFLVLELMNRLKAYTEEKEELKRTCYELVHMAINVSKARDEQTRVS